MQNWRREKRRIQERYDRETYILEKYFHRRLACPTWAVLGSDNATTGGKATRKGSGKRRTRSKGARTQVRTFFPLFFLASTAPRSLGPILFCTCATGLSPFHIFIDIGPRESHLSLEWFSPIYVYYRVGSDGVLLLLSLEFDRCLLPQV